jgi:hypothetical protein
MPYIANCEQLGTDGNGFTLEANTSRKYKIVSSQDCRTDDDKLRKACKKLIEFAHMNKEIHI